MSEPTLSAPLARHPHPDEDEPASGGHRPSALVKPVDYQKLQQLLEQFASAHSTREAAKSAAL